MSGKKKGFREKGLRCQGSGTRQKSGWEVYGKWDSQWVQARGEGALPIMAYTGRLHPLLVYKRVGISRPGREICLLGI